MSAKDIKDMRFNYRNCYLKSERWRRLKDSVKQDLCFCCDNQWKKRNENLEFDENKEHIEVHHVSYLNLNTDLERNDLISVCTQCHDDIHDLVLMKVYKLNEAHLIVRETKQNRNKNIPMRMGMAHEFMDELRQELMSRCRK